ncbi:MAG: fatty acid-binding protein DegV [Dehalococcoidales bacterium]|jgi:DegV family protein with EDD domain|nr:fatty acid-binding protein DegV [Dehalococcoidales bacterium]|tara:strand:+ start:91 stop:954 length:864 start_codon:yes stop_codon:yes gene_type:complete
MVKKVAIVTDTTACIPQEQAEKYSIEVVPVNFIFGDKVYRDGIDMSPTEFYTRLRKVKKLPTTSGSLPDPFLEAYHKASQRAASILCITPPAKLSGMSNSARLAKETAKEALPDVAIEVLDCGTAAAAQGLVVLAAARAAAQGKNLTGVIETAKGVMQRVNLFATLDTLYYLVKGGRVHKAAALTSSLLRIKPIFTITGGDAQPVTNARTMRGAIHRILKIMKEKVVKGQPLHVAVMHADALDKAADLSNRIPSQFDCEEIFITEFTPVMGVHTGPGLIGVAFYSGD